MVSRQEVSGWRIWRAVLAAQDPVLRNVCKQLFRDGSCHIRTGDRRSLTTARKIAKEAAELIDLEITTKKAEGYLLVMVKNGNPDI